MSHTVAQSILVVDDSRMYASFLCNILESDYHCEIALDGVSAIKKACEFPPDLILLDIVMPEMDGYRVCEILKKNLTTRDIPIIFMTSMDAPEDEAKGLELGAVDYITKPYRMPIVRARIKNHLKTQRLLAELRSALHEVETLKGLLPICSHCKRIREEDGSWHELEDYLSQKSELSFSHNICPQCRHELYPLVNGSNGNHE